MADAAVIFDVDGVLLELTRPEEDAFFVPFERRYGLKGLSRDWNSYAIRNDENIIAEILSRHGLRSMNMAESSPIIWRCSDSSWRTAPFKPSSFRELWSFCKIFAAACAWASPRPISSALPNCA